MSYNKKKYIIVILILCITIFTTSCSPEWPKYITMAREYFTGNTDVVQETVVSNTEKIKTDTRTQAVDANAQEMLSWQYVDFSGIDWNSIIPYDTDNSLLGHPGYAYSVLNEEEQRTYEEMYYAAITFSDSYKLTSTDIDLVKKVFNYVSADHPELFWVEGYKLTHTSRAGKITEIDFSVSKQWEQGEVVVLQTQIADYVKECLNGMEDKWNVYKKVKYIYEYIINHTVYDLSSENNQNICSVFLGGASVCQGYSVATQYLLLTVGIPSITVTGEAVNRGSHAWNLVKMDGAYYYLDTTWGSPSFSESSKATDDMILYDYLCISDQDLADCHKADGNIVLPECNANKYNYFLQEEQFFDNWDKDQFVRVLEKTMKQERNYVSIRFETAEAVSEALTALITNYEFFDYLNTAAEETGSTALQPITYFENSSLHIITFAWNLDESE